MKTKLNAKELEAVTSNAQLARYLESLLVGRPATPRSWLYDERNGNLTPEEVLDDWKTVLQSLENGTEAEQNVYQFDISQEEKWGPQGAVKPIAELMDIVEQGFGSSPIPKAFKTKLWKLAKESVTASLLSVANCLRPASYDHVVDDMRARDTLESNSGWPLFARRKLPEVREASIRDAKDGSWRDYPAIALFRNYNQKTRLVWMFPMSANLVEGSYFQPLQSVLMRAGFDFLAPWKGFDAVRRLVTAEYRSGSFIAASDFSSTDAHFTLNSTLEVFDVIQYCFQAKYREGLRDSLVHMHTIPLVIGPDTKEIGEHGVSSGSNWTNFIETIFDWILAEYVRLYSESGYQGLYAIGDDMSWVSSSYDAGFADELERIGESVGQVIKGEKTTNDRDKVKSLQRLFQRGYSDPTGQIRAVYSTIRALKSSVYPERFHDPRKWGSDMFCVRQFMILENCVDHPLFEDFVKFVCAGQHDLVPFAHMSKARIDEASRKAKLLPGLNPTYNQERRDSSLADFASIQIARNL